MTTLSVLQQWPDAAVHLAALKNTVVGDIRSLLTLPSGAPFAVCREVFSYIDYLGALYTGQLPVGSRFRQVLQNLFGSFNPHYASRAGDLYEMYRCGTVHQFTPKILTNPQGEYLYWLSYRGPRDNAQLTLQGHTMTVTHLVYLRNPGTPEAWLPVSLDCLVYDLERAIDVFAADTNAATRLANWNAVAPRFTQPAPHNFTL
jgi:hypothetical protein